MFTINLHNLIFYSFHGVHEEERILGNTYVVNVEISFNTNDRITALEQTINYENIYEIIKQRMAVPTALLETLTQELAQQIHAHDQRIASISVSIEKKHPPITTMEGSVSVNYKKNF